MLYEVITPFNNPDFYLNADFLKPALNNLGALYPLVITLVGNDGKGKLPAVLIQNSVPIRIGPACLGQQRLGMNRIMGIFFYLRVIYPGIRFIRTGSRLPEAQQNPIDNFPFIDGISYRLSDSFILKQRSVEIITEITVTESQIAIFIKTMPESKGIGLKPILDGREAHEIESARLQFEELGGRIGDNAIHSYNFV